MLLSELIRVSLFVSAVVAAYVATGVLAFRSLRRRTGDAAPATRQEIVIRRAVFALAGLGFICMAYGRFVEPYWLEVTHARIESTKLPRGARPIRIVQVSDIHSDPRPRLEERLPDVIAAQRPDLILFTGDAINSPEGLSVFKRCLSRLADIAPTFAVRGNWDVDYWEHLDLFGGTGVRELDATAAPVKIGGTEIWVAGVSAYGESRIGEAIAPVPAGALTLFLCHFPDYIFDVASRRVDLCLAGHTHGGQVALPFYGALTTNSRLDKRFEAGLYRVGQTWLYVNRGLGMEGDPAPRVRFCSRPEVTVIEVWPQP